ncbi:unnamed protein product [Amoebophrya sp. A120]|nr:unnamed protein product [Amoebophrya sp. A120]|eukprot:GSA120T00011530001.1
MPSLVREASATDPDDHTTTSEMAPPLPGETPVVDPTAQIAQLEEQNAYLRRMTQLKTRSLVSAQEALAERKENEELLLEQVEELSKELQDLKTDLDSAKAEAQRQIRKAKDHRTDNLEEIRRENLRLRTELANCEKKAVVASGHHQSEMAALVQKHKIEVSHLRNEMVSLRKSTREKLDALTEHEDDRRLLAQVRTELENAQQENTRLLAHQSHVLRDQERKLLDEHDCVLKSSQNEITLLRQRLQEAEAEVGYLMDQLAEKDERFTELGADCASLQELTELLRSMQAKQDALESEQLTEEEKISNACEAFENVVREAYREKWRILSADVAATITDYEKRFVLQEEHTQVLELALEDLRLREKYVISELENKASQADQQAQEQQRRSAVRFEQQEDGARRVTITDEVVVPDAGGCGEERALQLLEGRSTVEVPLVVQDEVNVAGANPARVPLTYAEQEQYEGGYLEENYGVVEWADQDVGAELVDNASERENDAYNDEAAVNDAVALARQSFSALDAGCAQGEEEMPRVSAVSAVTLVGEHEQEWLLSKNDAGVAPSHDATAVRHSQDSFAADHARRSVEAIPGSTRIAPPAPHPQPVANQGLGLEGSANFASALQVDGKKVQHPAGAFVFPGFESLEQAQGSTKATEHQVSHPSSKEGMGGAIAMTNFLATSDTPASFVSQPTAESAQTKRPSDHSEQVGPALLRAAAVVAHQQSAGALPTSSKSSMVHKNLPQLTKALISPTMQHRVVRSPVHGTTILLQQHSASATGSPQQHDPGAKIEQIGGSSASGLRWKLTNLPSVDLKVTPNMFTVGSPASKSPVTSPKRGTVPLAAGGISIAQQQHVSYSSIKRKTKNKNATFSVEEEEVASIPDEDAGTAGYGATPGRPELGFQPQRTLQPAASSAVVPPPAEERGKASVNEHVSPVQRNVLISAGQQAHQMPRASSATPVPTSSSSAKKRASQEQQQQPVQTRHHRRLHVESPAHLKFITSSQCALLESVPANLLSPGSTVRSPQGLGVSLSPHNRKRQVAVVPLAGNSRSGTTSAQQAVDHEAAAAAAPNKPVFAGPPGLGLPPPAPGTGKLAKKGLGQLLKPVTLSPVLQPRSPALTGVSAKQGQQVGTPPGAPVPGTTSSVDKAVSSVVVSASSSTSQNAAIPTSVPLFSTLAQPPQHVISTDPKVLAATGAANGTDQTGASSSSEVAMWTKVATTALDCDLDAIRNANHALRRGS